MSAIASVVRRTRRPHHKSRPEPQPEPVLDPVASAKAAGLRYVTDARPGIGRKRSGTGFRYVDPDGKPVRDPEVLGRIKSLVIPPAWTNVWICTHANGHLQATGRDARGRKQSRYHPRWRETRDETKYERMPLFGQALPRIREQVDHDLALPGLPREKVLATIVSLMENTLIRVGNAEYARENKSYGLTTMRTRHVEVEGSHITFTFQGKSRVHHTIDLTDRRLAKIVKRCEEIPGYELFQYLDREGNHHAVDSSDVNDYLRGITEEHFTAKDFRTWAGSVLACVLLGAYQPPSSATEAKRNIVEAVKQVARRLGNTPSVCRKCYVHPAVLENYLNTPLAAKTIASAEHRLVEELEDEKHTHRLREDEQALLNLLHQRLNPPTPAKSGLPSPRRTARILPEHPTARVPHSSQPHRGEWDDSRPIAPHPLASMRRRGTVPRSSRPLLFLTAPPPPK